MNLLQELKIKFQTGDILTRLLFINCGLFVLLLLLDIIFTLFSFEAFFRSGSMIHCPMRPPATRRGSTVGTELHAQGVTRRGHHAWTHRVPTTQFGCVDIVAVINPEKVVILFQIKRREFERNTGFVSTSYHPNPTFVIIIIFVVQLSFRYIGTAQCHDG